MIRFPRFPVGLVPPERKLNQLSMRLSGLSLSIRFATVSLLSVLTMPLHAGQLESLANNSPFAPLQGAASTAASDTASLEFRGVFADQGEYFFSVFDPATRGSVWVTLNEAGHAFSIRSFDAEKQTINADYKGRNLTLALKKAPAVAMAPDPTRPANVMPPPVGAPPAVAANSSEEANRLAAVAAEVRRRRAMRQQVAPATVPAKTP